MDPNFQTRVTATVVDGIELVVVCDGGEARATFTRASEKVAFDPGLN